MTVRVHAPLPGVTGVALTRLGGGREVRARAGTGVLAPEPGRW
ncbi:hypothetical protein [Streptomyces sp. NPDC052701]